MVPDDIVQITYSNAVECPAARTSQLSAGGILFYLERMHLFFFVYTEVNSVIIIFKQCVSLEVTIY